MFHAISWIILPCRFISSILRKRLIYLDDYDDSAKEIGIEYGIFIISIYIAFYLLVVQRWGKSWRTTYKKISKTRAKRKLNDSPNTVTTELGKGVTDDDTSSQVTEENGPKHCSIEVEGINMQVNDNKFENNEFAEDMSSETLDGLEVAGEDDFENPRSQTRISSNPSASKETIRKDYVSPQDNNDRSPRSRFNSESAILSFENNYGSQEILANNSPNSMIFTLPSSPDSQMPLINLQTESYPGEMQDSQRIFSSLESQRNLLSPESQRMLNDNQMESLFSQGDNNDLLENNQSPRRLKPTRPIKNGLMSKDIEGGVSLNSQKGNPFFKAENMASHRKRPPVAKKSP